MIFVVGMEPDSSAAAAATAAGGGSGSSDVEKKKLPEGEPKVKRKMKTASQLEILENTYAGLLSFSFHYFLFINLPYFGF